MDKRIEEKIKKYEDQRQSFIRQKEQATVAIHRLNGAIAGMQELAAEDEKAEKEAKPAKKAK